MMGSGKGVFVKDAWMERLCDLIEMNTFHDIFLTLLSSRCRLFLWRLVGSAHQGFLTQESDECLAAFIDSVPMSEEVDIIHLAEYQNHYRLLKSHCRREHALGHRYGWNIYEILSSRGYLSENNKLAFRSTVISRGNS